jgi:16S rRNA (cytosine967-C5)-methyltransferase
LRPEPLADLTGKMDLVFVDAPCTGSGTWRRHPDAKWRLTEAQLHKRMAEQDVVLADAADYVKPGGRLVYVTCSLLAEENEDRISAFRESHPGFEVVDALGQIAASGQVDAAGLETLAARRAGEHYLRLTPLSAGTDGFFVAVMRRSW